MSTKARQRSVARDDNVSSDISSSSSSSSASSASTSSKAGGGGAKVSFDASKELATITQADIDQYQTEVKRVDPLLSSLDSRIKEEMKTLEESEARRKLYVELELLRLDFSEVPAVSKYLQAQGHAKVAKSKEGLVQLRNHTIGASVEDIMARFDKLRTAMAVRVRRDSVLFRVFHFLLCFFYILSCMPLFYCLAPLRLLHPLFRKAGVSVSNHPVDFMQRVLCRGMMAAFNVTVTWEGVENLDPNQSTIGMFSHQSSYDAFAICSGPVSFRLLGKKSLFFLPFIGQLAYLWGHIPIDRSNLTRAKNSLDQALHMMRDTGRSVGIFPEGTRSPVGRLIDFKKGPFHTAIQAKMPISPIIVYGAGELWYAKDFTGSSGEIIIRVLPKIHVLPTDTHATLRSRVQREFLKAYPKPISASVKRLSDPLVDLFLVPAIYAALYVLKLVIWG